MDAEEVAKILAQHRARREELRQIGLRIMDTIDAWQRRRYRVECARVDTVIAMAKQMLAQAACRAESTGPREQEQPALLAQREAETRPPWDPIATECWLPEVDESLLANFEAHMDAQGAAG